MFDGVAGFGGGGSKASTGFGKWYSDMQDAKEVRERGGVETAAVSAVCCVLCAVCGIQVKRYLSARATCTTVLLAVRCTSVRLLYYEYCY